MNAETDGALIFNVPDRGTVCWRPVDAPLLAPAVVDLRDHLADECFS